MFGFVVFVVALSSNGIKMQQCFVLLLLFLLLLYSVFLEQYSTSNGIKMLQYFVVVVVVVAFKRISGADFNFKTYKNAVTFCCCCCCLLLLLFSGLLEQIKLLF
jgi:NhaP-type Na+/H+ and K+/H+ antiporter